jgi:fused signal recognition particle receptor
MFDLFKRDRAADAKPWSERLKEGLARSREKFGGAIASALRRPVLDDDTLEAIETALLTADVGVTATATLIEDLRARWKRAGGQGDPKSMLKDALVELLAPLEKPLVVGAARPYVIMLAGVNGAGKTTTIGKLANALQAQGLSVLLAAGDTFRAAAREQLVVWGERNGISVIAQAGGDAAAVMFDAIGAARARGTDIVLADTAGRLPTQLHLMDEIRKVQRVIRKTDATAPHETLLVLDASTGQNALAQVRAFDAALGLTGLVLTKLDGTAKGGIVAAIAREHPVPVRFVGVGEGLDDMKPFVAADFVEALVG